MIDLRQQTADVLAHLADRLREVGLGGALGSEIERMAIEVDRLSSQVHERCVVAVVGRVKAGKSTFLNALLGDEEDLAQVGVTETTATINYFRYGDPDPAKPVRCHWRNGQVTEESRQFLKELQGNDIETLQRAVGIAHLEYLLSSPYLQKVTLVDTPGTGAVVDEHQSRTAEFMRLSNELRERHHRETERLGSQADAVVYLVGAVAREGDREFLEDFAHATGGQARATNALGVMAKVDLSPAVLERRGELAEKIAAQLQGELNTVVPVSAGLERALQKFCRGGDQRFRQVEQILEKIPTDLLTLLLSSDEIFCHEELPDCPIGPAERAKLVKDLDWGVFRTLATIAAAPVLTSAEKIAHLRDIAGFATLRQVLERCFFERGHLLRCFRVVRDARRALDLIKYMHLPAARKLDRENGQRLARFLDLVHSAHWERSVTAELEEILRSQLSTDVGRQLEELHSELDRMLSGLFHELMACNEEFEGLQRLQGEPGAFQEHDLEELRPLFGLHGTGVDHRLRGRTDLDFVRERMRAWRQTELSSAQGTLRKDVAGYAVRRYGILLETLLTPE